MIVTEYQLYTARGRLTSTRSATTAREYLLGAKRRNYNRSRYVIVVKYDNGRPVRTRIYPRALDTRRDPPLRSWRPL